MITFVLTAFFSSRSGQAQAKSYDYKKQYARTFEYMNDVKTWVEISESALKSNIRAFRRHVGEGTPIMAVVKSNAYGHGLVNVAKTADKAGAQWFGVDNVDEGLELRRAGIAKPVLILGYTRNDRLKDCIKHQLSFVVYNLETARTLRTTDYRLRTNKSAFVHIKIETGTSRQGVSGNELLKLAKELKKIPGVVIEGAGTHFANIEDTTDHSYAELQLNRFKEGLSQLLKLGINPPWKHAACSAATVLFPDTYFNLVRLGISMYGLWSSEQVKSKKSKVKSLEIEPVLAWKTIVAQIKRVKKGTPVSYGLTERVIRDSILAVLPIGYWDGFDRGLSGRGYVLVGGKRCKIIGRVCMNMCMADVTNVARVKIEDEVVLIGRQGKEILSAEEFAAHAGTINYEVITRINPLIPRMLVK